MGHLYKALTKDDISRLTAEAVDELSKKETDKEVGKKLFEEKSKVQSRRRKRATTGENSKFSRCPTHTNNSSNSLYIISQKTSLRVIT